MKLKFLFITGALALSCGRLQALDLAPPRGEKLHPQQLFTELEGIAIWNYQNEKLGRVKFITADLENGRLVEVVIASGGFFGMGSRVTSAPPRAFTLDAANQVLRLDVSKARFDAAPPFRTSDVASYSEPARVAAVIRHYGLQPWFVTEGQTGSNNARTLRLGHVERTDHILGMQIKNTNGKYLGQVGGVQMDLPTGQITQVVNETQAMGESNTYILQARAMRYNAAQSGLVMNESFASMEGKPHLQWVGENREYFQEESSGSRRGQASTVSKATLKSQARNIRDVKRN